MTSNERKTVKEESSQTEMKKLSLEMEDVLILALADRNALEIASKLDDRESTQEPFYQGYTAATKHWLTKVKALEASSASTKGLEGVKAQVEEELKREERELSNTIAISSYWQTFGNVERLKWFLKLLEADSPKTGKERREQNV